jgi:hypothetical protein
MKSNPSLLELGFISILPRPTGPILDYSEHLTRSVRGSPEPVWSVPTILEVRFHIWKKK